MSKQFFIYERAVPVSPVAHKDLSVQSNNDYSFASETNSIPLTTAEFLLAAKEYAIVFTGNENSVFPVAVLGVRENENLYISEDNRWNAEYIPAFIRRYPFVFSHDAESGRHLLCVDESYSGTNTVGLGERLFGESGEQTQYTKTVLGFMQAYQTQSDLTREFCNTLKALDLLQGVEARVSMGSGQQASLKGFQVINRDKLNALPDNALSEMARNGGLEVIYAHLQSLKNMERLGVKAKTAAGKG